MTDRAEIERLLNMTGRTLEGLPEQYSAGMAKVTCERVGRTVKEIGNMLLHQSDVIELLVCALRDSLDKQKEQSERIDVLREMIESTNLINGRTPEEIKKGLRRCEAVCLEDCPYYRTGIKCSECTTHLSKDALAYIQHLEATQPKWISVKERLPKYVEVALVYAYRYSGGIAEPEGRIYIAMFIPSNRSWMELPDGFAVTHWMPLPEPPEEASP